MQVNDALIDKLCDLAKLEFAGEARSALMQDLNKILAFVEQINALDTTQVQPLQHMTAETNHLRKDEPHTTLTHAEALQNAPKKDSDYLRVPKVLDK
jgi:aspartyl-tRNA(Asn)/glutamyl-tRNA(Gln) amidotransferase subunit C